jgi:hypothetical protein
MKRASEMPISRTIALLAALGCTGCAVGAMAAQPTTIVDATSAHSAIVDSSGNFYINIAGINGTAPGSTNPLYTEDPRLTFTGNYANVLDQNSAGILAAAQAPLAAQATTTVDIGNTGGLGANNAAAVGNPNTVAGFAQNAEPATLATSGQTSALSTDLAHKLITLPYANPENFVQGTVAAAATTPGTSLLASAGTGLYNYITALSCFNSGGSATTIVLTNGSGGTVFWQGYAAASGGGFTISFPTPIGGKSLSTATPVFVYAGTSTTSLSCNASGYKGS